jgi:pyridoxamine 5'-phosphate oxidase
MKMSDSNREYELMELTESNVDPNPFKQFQIWFKQAESAGSKLPNAMTLATATRHGVPSARMVLLKGFDERGFVFYTNYESQKGMELQENPIAALNFYWSVLDRQVRITGQVTKTSREESEEYFHTRPVDSQFGAWASRQSEVISGREPLEERMRQLMSEYDGKQIPLPPYWGGFRLSPTSMEFWQNRASRLHDRLRYTRQNNDNWLIERLSP